ncbi:hypothetical protein AVEN_105308-1 [Araneus ventricosus]|uniref:Uncharacterized protein n=1 Tax=Araneus ventricosus TaxID=182803 RepID=A0A4Y2VX09_ARAVE|nr:hypothetical protein AVEN_105308-1 [Araneus ventricosus]
MSDGEFTPDLDYGMGEDMSDGEFTPDLDYGMGEDMSDGEFTLELDCGIWEEIYDEKFAPYFGYSISKEIPDEESEPEVADITNVDSSRIISRIESLKEDNFCTHQDDSEFEDDVWDMSDGEFTDMDYGLWEDMSDGEFAPDLDHGLWAEIYDEEFAPELGYSIWKQMSDEESEPEVADITNVDSSRIISRIESLKEDNKFCTQLSVLWTIVNMTIFVSFCFLPIFLNFPFLESEHILLIGYGISRKLVHVRLLPKLRELRNINWRPVPCEAMSVGHKDADVSNVVSQLEMRRDSGLFFARLCVFHFKWIITQMTILYVFSVQPVLLNCPFSETALLLLIGYGSNRNFIHNMLLPQLRLHRSLGFREWKLLLEEKSVDNPRESSRPFDFVEHNIIDIEVFIVSARLLFPVDPVIFRIGCAFHALLFFYLNGKYVLGYSFRMLQGVFRLVSCLLRKVRAVF